MARWQIPDPPRTPWLPPHPMLIDAPIGPNTMQFFYIRRQPLCRGTPSVFAALKLRCLPCILIPGIDQNVVHIRKRFAELFEQSRFMLHDHRIRYIVIRVGKRYRQPPVTDASDYSGIRVVIHIGRTEMKDRAKAMTFRHGRAALHLRVPGRRGRQRCLPGKSYNVDQVQWLIERMIPPRNIQLEGIEANIFQCLKRGVRPLNLGGEDRPGSPPESLGSVLPKQPPDAELRSAHSRLSSMKKAKPGLLLPGRRRTCG